jgi:hypothetical protein
LPRWRQYLKLKILEHNRTNDSWFPYDKHRPKKARKINKPNSENPQGFPYSR